MSDKFSRRKVKTRLRILATAASVAFASTAFAQVSLEPNAIAQITSLRHEKVSRTVTQNKIASQLWFALQASRGKGLAGVDRVYATATDAAKIDAAGMVRVRIAGKVSSGLLQHISSLGGKASFSSVKGQAILAAVPLNTLEGLAKHADVQRVSLAAPARTNVGALTSQGYISHKANLVVASGVNGNGVKVGVLSDSVDSLAALIGTGDLPPDTTIINDGDGVLQDGGAGSSEGTAMLEIVHDLAPGAKLYFATAFNGADSFADNIRRLRTDYHCDIIVDDVSYFDEAVFQDSMVAQAVNDVTADGALYFSSAANSGNLTSGTSGTWEGDFRAGEFVDGVGTFHLFNATSSVDTLTSSTSWVGLHWSDPSPGAANDYDLFLLDGAGNVVCASVDPQTGSSGSFPLEACYNAGRWPSGTRIVVVQWSGEARALHIDTERGTLSIATSGATFGHNAGKNTVSTAAVHWNSAKTGTKAFVGGAANPTEIFSSDGPRRIFYNPDGTPITPGNFLFSTNGGTSLVKPDIAAADGVATKTPGFNPFFGTSAAAPHAAAVAALIKSARPDYTNAKILAAIKATALDIRVAGLDRDAGYGIVMAREAVNYALTH